MNIFIDADASPVQKETIEVANKFDIHVYVVKSYAHFSIDPPQKHVDFIYVDSDKDAADMAIVKKATKGDIVITQDYGLATLCLAKGCYVLHHKGFRYSEKNMDDLLSKRHFSQKARRAGFKTKGPSRFTTVDRQKFVSVLTSLIEQLQNSE